MIAVHGFCMPEESANRSLRNCEATPIAVLHSDPPHNSKPNVPIQEARPSVVALTRAEPDTESTGEQPLAITKREAARLLSISERTLFQLVADGEIPVVRLKRKLLFRLADLESWLRSKCVRQK